MFFASACTYHGSLSIATVFDTISEQEILAMTENTATIVPHLMPRQIPNKSIREAH